MSEGYPNPYYGVQSGEVSGSATAKRLPSVRCGLVMITADTSNAGSVFLGGAGVTAPNGTTDTTTGIELEPGDSSGWIPVQNLDTLYIICDNAGDDIEYLIVN